jgi:hypothetical protein
MADGPDKKYGYGVLDVESAVNRALSKLGPSTLAVAKLNMSGNVTANYKITRIFIIKAKRWENSTKG